MLLQPFHIQTECTERRHNLDYRTIIQRRRRELCLTGLVDSRRLLGNLQNDDRLLTSIYTPPRCKIEFKYMKVTLNTGYDTKTIKYFEKRIQTAYILEFSVAVSISDEREGEKRMCLC